MRVFLTGALGFVGSHVARLLVRHGHEVHALVLDNGARDAEDELARTRLGEEGDSIARVRGDLLRPASWEHVVEKERFDACVHLGWYANPKDYLSSRVNVDLLSASATLGMRLVDAGCRRVVMAGTCFEYDVALRANTFLSETSSLSPRHLYSTCKRSLFEVMSHLTAGTSTSFAWARLFFLYGPHESRGRLVPAVIDALLGGEEARVTTGEQVRDFMHVADAAAGIVQVLETDALTGPVNVASGSPVRVRDVVETIARVLGQQDRVAWGAASARPNDPPFVCADVTKLTATGFRPEHDLESGLRDTVAWSKSWRARAASVVGQTG
jgi:nucleoside-diphosphate-sugar epimerase